MLFCIDGTGEHDDLLYMRDMSRGFCYHISQQYRHAIYRRGPTIFGTETVHIANEVLDMILRLKLGISGLAELRASRKPAPLASIQRIGRSDADKTPINLVGHSRGGAACIYVAQELARHDIPVHSMLLFDAVDRTAGIDTTRIPPNVGYCLHLMRDPQFGDFFHHLPAYRQLRTTVMAAQKLPADAAGLPQFDWSAIAAKSGPSPELERLRRLEHYHTIMQNMCRLNCTVRGVPTGFGFGNTGTLWSAPTRYLSQKFKATHGAMGGAPMQVSKQIDDPLYWHMVADAEVMAMAQVQARAQSFLRQMGELGKLSLDYIPISTIGSWDQTAPGASFRR